MSSNWKRGDLIQGRWQILDILGGPGKSGSGIVYVVRDRVDDAVVAAKTFQDEVFARDPSVAKSFEEEARKWVNLDLHPYVVNAFRVDRIGGKPFVFTQYFPEGDLSRWIGTPFLIGNLPQVVAFAIYLCEGMMHALSRGIDAHRDIKPQNCLITENRALALGDFGLAKAMATRSGATVRGGTPEYMPPEQWDRFEQADERSDVYSFGATVYAMLAGRPPFGVQPQVSIEELERRHRHDSPQPFGAQGSAINSLVQTCLAKDPDCRYENFGVIRERLAEIYRTIMSTPLRKPIDGLELDAGSWISKGSSLDELRRYEDAIRSYDSALEIEPNNTMALNNKGATLRYLKRYEESLDCLERALKLDPQMVQAWMNKGNTLDDMGDPEKAIPCFERAIKINPDYPEAWYNRALALDRCGRQKDALESYDEALKLAPWYEEAWTNKGIILRDLGQYEEALSCYDRAIKINPSLEEAQYGKAVALDLMGESEKALPYFDQAINLNAHDDLNWYGKGVALTKLKRFEEAVLCYDNAISVNSRLEKAWINKGSALLALGKFDDAVVCSQRGIELNPTNGGAWYNKGMALKALKNTSEALKCFQEAHRLEYPLAAPMIQLCQAETGTGDNAEAQYKMGMAFFSTGRIFEALVCFELAQRLGSSKAGTMALLCYDVLDIPMK